MMTRLDGAALRALVHMLPPHVFDDLCDELPEMFESLTEEKVINYIHWEPTTVEHTADHVAQDYGYADYATMEYEGPYLRGYDEGVLIIE